MARFWKTRKEFGNFDVGSVMPAPSRDFEPLEKSILFFVFLFVEFLELMRSRLIGMQKSVIFSRSGRSLRTQVRTTDDQPNKISAPPFCIMAVAVGVGVG
jgi:hypothetical protein